MALPQNMDPFLRDLFFYFTNHCIGEKWLTSQSQDEPIHRNLRWSLYVNSKEGNLWVEVKHNPEDIYVHIATKNAKYFPCVRKLGNTLPKLLEGYSLQTKEHKYIRTGYCITDCSATEENFRVISLIIGKLVSAYCKVAHSS